MSETVERRNTKVTRVELATLVDICTRDTSLPPFQGKSGNVSGRGMHVRTSHLPEIGTPLVCRFEHNASEVLVEGRVAWRSEGEDGGEFGVQFTAVDADSAEILRSLRPMSSVSSAFKPRINFGAVDDEDDEEDHLLLKSGDRVRLHIDGLAAPMKASVHEGGRQKVRLGSNLEFLKVGRPVEIESVDDGARRGAKVDSVNVVLNPSTSVPELVVMLRYEGEGEAAPAVRATSGESEPPEYAASDEDEFDSSTLSDATLALKSKVKEALDKAQGALFWARGAAAKVGEETKQAVQAAREKMSESQREEKTERPKVLRTQTPRRTAPAHRPSNVARAGFVSKRIASSPAREPSRSGTAESPPPRSNRMAVVGTAAVVSALALGLFYAKGHREPSLSHAKPADPKNLAADQAASSPSGTSAVPGPTSPVGAPNPSTPAPGSAAPKATPEGIIAEVPLFGPRPIATTEPLVRPAEGEALREKRAAAASVPDEKFPEAAPEASGPSSAKDAATTWGRGQLNLPTVHRIRLDAAGSEIVGVAEPSGFAVVVPGRKAMETGRAIEKRDRRILHVKTSNTAEGARINFAFRGPVPPYRVRLKNDFIEFFVSAPEGVRAEP